MSIPEFTKQLENLRIEADTLKDFHQTSADSLLTIGKTLESVFNQLNGAIETAHADQIDSRNQSKLVSECIAKLLGDKPTEDEIADPVPGGNGGVFKSNKMSESDQMDDIKKRFENNQTCTTDEIESAKDWFGSIVWRNAIEASQLSARNSHDWAKETLAKGHGLSSDKGGFAPSDLTGGEHKGYVPDPETDDKEGGAG